MAKPSFKDLLRAHQPSFRGSGHEASPISAVRTQLIAGGPLIAISYRLKFGRGDYCTTPGAYKCESGFPRFSSFSLDSIPQAANIGTRQMTSQSLPPPCEGQPYFDVLVLEAGLMDLKDEMFITNAEPGKVTRLPSLSFLLTHSLTGKKVVFDLGIRKDWENYPPIIVKWINEIYPVDVKQDVPDSLSKGGISPDNVDFVCLSHLHWDHTGDTQLFKHSTFLVGERCQALLETPHPHIQDHILPPGRTMFLDLGSGHSIGPFPHALDFFDDGSLYLVDAPGHLPGHMNALVRTSDDGGWLYLAGDSAHHWKLITLEAQVAVGHAGDALVCAHDDKEAAEAHILRTNELWKTPRVRVMLAHDEPWYVDNNGDDAIWPKKLPSL